MAIAVNFKHLERRSLKKTRTRNLCDTGAILCQLSYDATHWERRQSIDFKFSRVE